MQRRRDVFTGLQPVDRSVSRTILSRSSIPSPGVTSIELDVPAPDHFRPRRNVPRDDTRELLRGGMRGLSAVRAQALLNLRLFENSTERLIEARDDLLRRAGRRPHGVPAGDRVA